VTNVALRPPLKKKAVHRRHPTVALVLALLATFGFSIRPCRIANDFLAALERETVAFRCWVVLIHGDSHTFPVDKPMTSSTTGQRVEIFQPEIVEENTIGPLGGNHGARGTPGRPAA
jgi:hypothetical protein